MFPAFELVKIQSLSPESGGFKQEVSFKDFHPPETAATTSTATDSNFGRIDDDVPVCFYPRYIGATLEMSSKTF
jgi:hypothetical protein